MSDPSGGAFWTHNAGLYSNMARQHRAIALQVRTVWSEYIASNARTASPEELARNVPKPTIIDAAEHDIICVVFASMAVEAFINAYGEKTLGSTMKHLDRGLEVPAKWIVIPALVGTPFFTESEHPFGLLKALCKNRNNLVHDKPQYVTIQQLRESVSGQSKALDRYKYEQQAEQAIATLDELAARVPDSLRDLLR
jgi:hypothetical protein